MLLCFRLEAEKIGVQDYLGWKYGWHKDGETIVFDVVPKNLSQSLIRFSSIMH